MANTIMNIRMDSEVKKQAEALFGELGMNMTTAINIFLKQSIRENGIPFRLSADKVNTATLEAIAEGEKIIKEGKARFNSTEEMFADLDIQKMLKPEYTARFKKDLKAVKKRNLDIELLKDIINKLCLEEALPEKNKDHNLFGDWFGCRECHILPDWILIYQAGNGIIVFERTGTHSDLFK